MTQATNTKQAGWTRIDGEYRHINGGRVYKYVVKTAWRPQEWGAQLPQDASGSGGFVSMTEAMRFVEKFSEES